MKRLALVLAATLPLLATAQGGPPPGRGPGAARLFDPATVVSVSGTIVDVQRVDRGQGHAGVHLLLATPDGEIPVHLGPDFWVDAQKVKLAKGDAVSVKGSRVQFEGRTVLLAVTVTRGADVLTLRDASGRPAWGGGGPGPR
jgi:hypothetical protein